MASNSPPATAASGGEQEQERQALSPPEDPLRRFRDVPITISVQLDRKRVKVEEVLEFRKGSIIELSRSAGENVDLLLDGENIGNGEIVVIEDTMGLRITDFCSASRKDNADED